jgi:GNAT superfamily N-acetyltransferase
MSIEVARLDPSTVGNEELGNYYEVVSAAGVVDRPDDPPITRAWMEGWLKTPDSPARAALHWEARLDGELVGIGKLNLPGHESSDSAEVELQVHPEWRRRGVARSLLRAMVPSVRERGRTKIFAWFVDGAPGSLLAATLPVSVVHTNYLQVLHLGAVDHGLWDVAPSAGFRAVRWTGAAPEELLDDFATAKTAIQDAPLGGDSYRIPAWTSERIRAAEADLASRGVDHRVVVAVETSTGNIAGLTELQFHPGRPQLGIQQDTSVRREYRGRGLGRFVKSAMLEWVTATRDPRPVQVFTTTATENTRMRRINEDLGFVLARKIQLGEADPEKLSRALEI